jgi:hypothetical protein
VNQRGSGFQALFEIDHGRQLLELDVDIVERVLGDISACGDHDGEGFADMANLVLGERNLRPLVENDTGNRGRGHQQRAGLPVITEVVGGVGGDHARSLQGLRNIDLQDSRMRDLAAQQRRMQHPRQFDVIDEQRLAGEKPAILVALDRFSERAGRHGLAPHSFGRRHHGIDDVLVSGAATKVT